MMLIDQTEKKKKMKQKSADTLRSLFMEAAAGDKEMSFITS